jgi:hypothetical protein
MMAKQDSKKTVATFGVNLGALTCFIALAIINVVFLALPAVWHMVFPDAPVSQFFQEYSNRIEILIIAASFIVALLAVATMITFPVLQKLIPNNHAVEQIEKFNEYAQEGKIEDLNKTMEKCEPVTKHLRNLEEYYEDIFRRRFFQVIHSPEGDYRARILKARKEAENKALEIAKKKDPEQPSPDESVPKIYLTNFAKTVDDDVYHKDEIAHCDDHPNVHVYKIITLCTAKKFETYRKICSQATTGARENGVTKDKLQNLHIACLCSRDEHGDMNLDGLLSEKTKLPKIFGVQVIDDDEIILLDPRCAVYARSGVGSNPVYIKNNAVAELFIDYYEELWDVLREENNDLGMVIYDPHLEWDVISERLERIEASLMG